MLVIGKSSSDITPLHFIGWNDESVHETNKQKTEERARDTHSHGQRSIRMNHRRERERERKRERRLAKSIIPTTKERQFYAANTKLSIALSSHCNS